MTIPVPPIVVYALAGLVLLNLRSIAVPLGWFEVFFHELSHGIAALVTGGKVLKLELDFDGSGSLTHAGSWFTILVSFAGYAGASLWGLLIYKLFSPLDKTTQKWTVALLLIVAVSTLLWVKDLQSLGVSLAILTILFVTWRFVPDRWASHLMGLVGAGLMVSSSQSAWSLTSIQGERGDAAALAQKTLIVPGVVWILLWIAVSGLCLWCIYRRERKEKAVFRF